MHIRTRTGKLEMEQCLVAIRLHIILLFEIEKLIQSFYSSGGAIKEILDSLPKNKIKQIKESYEGIKSKTK